MSDSELDAEERAWQSYISPHFKRSDLGTASPNAEQMICLFADRVWGWQIDVADRLIDADEESAFAVLGIVMSYFEMIGKHLEGYEGTGESRVHFRVGFDSAFPEIDGDLAERIANRLYRSVRNGLYHDTITTAGVIIARHPAEDKRLLFERPSLDGSSEVVLNPELLVDRMRRHFAAYVGGLLGDREGEMRAAFLRRFLWADRAGTG